MKPDKLRELTVEDLEREGVQLSEQLFRLRCQRAAGRLENPMKFRQVRRDLARIKTIIGEKRRQAEA